jgi:hypothetical protein
MRSTGQANSFVENINARSKLSYFCLFLFVALTSRRTMAKSIIRSMQYRVAGFDGAACAAKLQKR